MRRHDLDLTSLVWGLLFLVIVGVWAAAEVGGPWRIETRWLVPGVLVLLGAAGLVSALAPRRSRDPEEPLPDLRLDDEA